MYRKKFVKVVVDVDVNNRYYHRRTKIRETMKTLRFCEEINFKYQCGVSKERERENQKRVLVTFVGLSLKDC